MGLILHEQLETDRLRLAPLSVEIAEGMIAGDTELLRAESRLMFPDPFRLPPMMMDDYLTAVAQRLRYETSQVGSWGWLFFDKESRKVLGTIGVNGPTGDIGAVGLAFSIYEDQENQGYTKEATKAVVDWILAQVGVKSLRMTIHPKNFAAVRVAQHSKFELKGTVQDEVVGEVHIYEAKKRVILPLPLTLV
jgi:RimJ/RimL family protein N-acetyltransferase